MRSARRARPTTSQSYAHLESIIEYNTSVSYANSPHSPHRAPDRARSSGELRPRAVGDLGVAQVRVTSPRARRRRMSTYVYVDADGAGSDRKAVQRRTVDYTATTVRYVEERVYAKDPWNSSHPRPLPGALLDFMPPVAYPHLPATSFATKFVHVSSNKIRTSVNKVMFMPDGRRLLTCSQNGEFTLWNGMSFNFETILQAHNGPIRCAEFSNNDNWLLTGDDEGNVKYFQTTFNNLRSFQVHKEPVTSISFARSDLKFATGSDDASVKIVDFARAETEHPLSGHSGDVKTVEWHPYLGLVASGGKDGALKMWDPKSGHCATTLYGHKNAITCSKWNKNGNWLVTGSKDQTLKVWDLRMLKEIGTYRGHGKDVTEVVWHPTHEAMFTSGAFDGSINYWLVGAGEAPHAEIKGGHEASILSLAWHPAGHILVSGSQDNTTKFWCRNRPGEVARDTAAGRMPAGGAVEAVIPTTLPRPVAPPGLPPGLKTGAAPPRRPVAPSRSRAPPPVPPPGAPPQGRPQGRAPPPAPPPGAPPQGRPQPPGVGRGRPAAPPRRGQPPPGLGNRPPGL